MSGRPDVVVVGGGIAGLTVALALARRGCGVMVIDERRDGAPSALSAGLLAPGLGFTAAALPAAVAARDAYPDFVAGLRSVTGITVPLDRGGIIQLMDGREGDATMAAAAPTGVRWLDAAALGALEPLLAHHAGAVLHPSDGSVDARSLMKALHRAVAAETRIETLRSAVARVDVADGRAAVVTLRAGRRTAARVVLAAGAWSGGLEGLPRPVPVRPVHGELLVLETESPGHVIYGSGGYLVPRGARRVLVGATSEDRGLDARTTAAGAAALQAIAARVLGIAGPLPVVAHVAGLRPVTPDGLPILGTDPDRRALAYMAGLSRNGILLAPWAAERVADEVTGGHSAELDPFRPERFA